MNFERDLRRERAELRVLQAYSFLAVSQCVYRIGELAPLARILSPMRVIAISLPGRLAQEDLATRRADSLRAASLKEV